MIKRTPLFHFKATFSISLLLVAQHDNEGLLVFTQTKPKSSEFLLCSEQAIEAGSAIMGQLLLSAANSRVESFRIQ
jgi:hypothetical protein